MYGSLVSVHLPLSQDGHRQRHNRARAQWLKYLSGCPARFTAVNEYNSTTAGLYQSMEPLVRSRLCSCSSGLTHVAGKNPHNVLTHVVRSFSQISTSRPGRPTADGWICANSRAHFHEHPRIGAKGPRCWRLNLCGVARTSSLTC